MGQAWALQARRGQAAACQGPGISLKPLSAGRADSSRACPPRALRGRHHPAQSGPEEPEGGVTEGPAAPQPGSAWGPQCPGPAGHSLANERPLVEADLPPGQPSQQAVRNRGQAERRLGKAGRHEAGVSWSSQPRGRAPPRQGPAPASLAWGLLGVLSCGAMGEVGRMPLATPPAGPDKAPALWSALPRQKGHPQALRPWARLCSEPLGEGCVGAHRQLSASGLVSRVPSGPPRGQR